MPDFTLCVFEARPKAHKCVRFLGIKDSYFQSIYIGDFDDDGCNLFWDVANGAPFKLKEPIGENLFD